MSADDSTRGPAFFVVFFVLQLKQLKRFQTLEQTVERRLGYAKHVVAFAAVCSALVLLYYIKFLWLLLLPAGLFVYLAIAHERRMQRLRVRRRSFEFFLCV